MHDEKTIDEENVELASGAWLIPTSGERKRQFGIINAWSPPRSPGTVSVALRRADNLITVRISEDALTLFMPEVYARMFAQTLTDCTYDLARLRSLYKEERLSERALYPVTPHNTEHDGELLFKPSPDERVAAHPHPVRIGFLKDEVALLMTKDDVLIAALRIDEDENNAHDVPESYLGILLFHNLPVALTEAFRIRKELGRNEERKAEVQEAKAVVEAMGIYAWCTTDKRRVDITELYISDDQVWFRALN